MPESTGPSDFESTRWTLIGRAGGSSASGRRDALQEVLEIYLPALRSWVTRKFHIDEHQADDIVQEFVVSRILQKNLLKAASEQRGRFRSLLLSSLQRFVFDQFRAQNAAKRAPQRAGSFDESNAEHSSVDSDTNDSFETEWAHSVLREAIQRMWKETSASGSDHVWSVFACRVLVPLTTSCEPIPYEKLASLCRFRDPRQASNVLVTAKRSFSRLLRSVIDEYAIDPSEVESELSDLKLVLLRSRAVSVGLLPDDVRNSLSFIHSSLLNVVGTSNRNLSRLFGVNSAKETSWGDPDIEAIVRHFLDSPLDALVGGATIPGEWEGRTARDLLSDREPVLDLLQAAKSAGRSMVEDSDEPTPSVVGAFFYFVSIAAALVKHNTLISRSEPQMLLKGMKRLQSQGWLDDVASSLLSEGISRLEDGRS